MSGRNESAVEQRLARKLTHKGFFVSAWNKFDFMIVVSTWVLIPVQYLMASDETVGRLVRLFRIARPLRAFRSFDGTKDVLKTFPRAIPDMGDVLALLTFIMIVYAILALVIHAFTEWLNGRLHRLDREDEEYRRQQLVNQTLAANAATPSVPPVATGAVGSTTPAAAPTTPAAAPTPPPPPDAG